MSTPQDTQPGQLPLQPPREYPGWAWPVPNLMAHTPPWLAEFNATHANREPIVLVDPEGMGRWQRRGRQLDKDKPKCTLNTIGLTGWRRSSMGSRKKALCGLEAPQIPNRPKRRK